MRMYIAAAIYQVGHHFFLKTLFDKMGIKCSPQLEEKWIAKDIAKVKKFDREHQTVNELKRKEHENISLQVEVKKRKLDIAKKLHMNHKSVLTMVFYNKKRR